MRFARRSVPWVWRTRGNDVDPWTVRLTAAGLLPRRRQIGEVDLHYAEGPPAGPPLLLLHAQHLDMFSYVHVLPLLVKHFHVFVVDYPGHGTTVVPDTYPMTAERIGRDLAAFIDAVIAAPTYVAGNSSGGLLAVWLAANRPDLVCAVVLEDPPLFSAEHPRIATTIADRSFATCADAVRDGSTDLLLYWIDHNRAFFTNHVAPGAGVLLAQVVKLYRWLHPGRPVDIAILPDDTVRQFIRGMDQYDPRFGAAFHDGSWHQGFDHAAALSIISCPVLLLHARHTVLPDGTLDGAMSQDDADAAMALLTYARYQKVEAPHVVHLAEPALYSGLLTDFFRTCRA